MKISHKLNLSVSILLLITLIVSCTPGTVVPMATAIATTTAAPTITPTPAPQSLADTPDLSTWVEEYVHAYGDMVTVNSTEMDAQELTVAIRQNPEAFMQTKEIEKGKYSFMVVNGTPLAILSNHKWEATSLKSLGEFSAIRFGSTVHEGGLFVNHAEAYQQILNQQFGIIAPNDLTIMDVSEVLKDPYYGKFVNGLAQTHALRFYNLFTPGDQRNEDNQPNLSDPLWQGAPPINTPASTKYQEKIRIAMAEKALNILTSNPNVTEIGFANEAFSATDDGYFSWEDCPYYRAFGDRWLIEAYLAAYKAIVQLGKVPGRDISLFYGDYNFYLPGNKSTIVHRELSRVKEEVAKELGIDTGDVPIIVEMEGHFSFDTGYLNANASDPRYWDAYYAGRLTYEEFKQNLTSFTDIGKVWLGEFTLLQGTAEQNTQFLKTIVEASFDSGNVESIFFWDLLEIDSDHWGKGDLLFTFDGESHFYPTANYYVILHTLFGEIQN